MNLESPRLNIDGASTKENRQHDMCVRGFRRGQYVLFRVHSGIWEFRIPRAETTSIGTLGPSYHFALPVETADGRASLRKAYRTIFLTIGYCRRSLNRRLPTGLGRRQDIFAATEPGIPKIAVGGTAGDACRDFFQRDHRNPVT